MASAGQQLLSQMPDPAFGLLSRGMGVHGNGSTTRRVPLLLDFIIKSVIVIVNLGITILIVNSTSNQYLEPTYWEHGGSFKVGIRFAQAQPNLLVLEGFALGISASCTILLHRFGLKNRCVHLV